MADELKGKKVAFLFTEGAEQVEVTEPLEAVKKAGAKVDIVSLECDPEKADDESYVEARYREVCDSIQGGMDALARRRRLPLFG